MLRPLQRLALATLALALTCGCRSAQAQSSIWAAWLQAMQRDGYGVVQGSALVNTPSYCTQVLLPIFGSCFLSDPADPYISPLMPLGSGYVDPYFGAVASQTLPNGTVVGQDFRLATTEAELAIVTLPPLATYFSYQSYLFSRLASDYSSPQKISPDPARAMLFATFSNSINDVDIKAQSGLGFGQGQVAFITTPNAALAAAMRQEFISVGGNPKLLFSDPMGSTLDPGLDASSDDFLTLLRYLIPENSTTGSRWVNGAAGNVSVFRIDQPSSVGLARFGATPLLNKTFNLDESSYQADITELSQLMQGWLETQESKNVYTIKIARSSEFVTSAGVIVQGAVGPYCISVGTYCVADQQDTDAYKTVSIGPLPSNQMVIVDGVNHALLNNSTMVSLTVLDDTAAQGVLGIWQTNPTAAGFTSGIIGGSAVTALHNLGLWAQASPQLQAAAPDLYVEIFTRGCTAQQTYCAQPFTTVVSSTAVPISDSVSVMERAYVLPGYPNGANPTDLVTPQGIY